MTDHQTSVPHSARAIELHTQWADAYADRYARAATAPYESCFAYGRYLLNDMVTRYLPADGSGLRLLDVGCGTGHQMAMLRERGYDVAGVDASEKMLEHAKANNPGAEIHCTDVAELPFATASFDYVICLEVLRHLSNSTPAVAEIARVLKPGGVALATAAPLFNLNAYWLVNRITSKIRIGNFRQLYQFFTTSWRLRRQFRAANFTVVEIHGLSLGPINWVERLARPALPTVLRKWERFDRALADLPVVREFSNMYLVRAVR